MPSSTSSSDLTSGAVRTSAMRPLVLLVIIAVAVAGFEIFARVVVERKSKVQRTINEEYREAIHIRHGAKKQLLVVGNSLVGHGVDFGELQSDLPGGWEAHRFWIYNTGYEDWYFGLRRLFGDGSRPDAVAVVFAALNWYGSGTRGDYSAQYLFRARDLPEVERRLDLNRTVAGSLWFAHYSKFFALRSEVRKVLLENVLPGLPQMNALIKPGQARVLTDDQVVEIATPRMKAYRDLASQYGARLVAIVPPIDHPGQEHQEALRRAAERAGVPIVVPFSRLDVPPGQFADDMHLTPEGAQRFTAVMMRQLAPVLDPRRR